MITFSQMPSELVLDPNATLSIVRAFHVIYTETLGRAGWDLSYSQLARKMGTSRRATAYDAVAWLEREGWITKIPHSHRPNLFGVNQARFDPYGTADVATPRTPRRPRGGTPQSNESGTPQRSHQESHPGESLPGDKQNSPTKEVVPVVGPNDPKDFFNSPKWLERTGRTQTGASE